MLDQDTKKRIDDLRDILVGSVPDPKSQIECITTAMVYKFMDDMDVQALDLNGDRNYFVSDFEQYAWGNLMDNKLDERDREIIYDDAIRKMSQNQNLPALFRGMFKDAKLPFRSPRTLTMFLRKINEFSYTDNSEILGTGYEYLLYILGSQGDAGQFRTPRHIIDFIVEIVRPKKDDKILDPACGSGGFLISSYKHVIRENSRNYDPKTYKHAFAISNAKEAAEHEIQQDGEFRGDKLTGRQINALNKNIQGYDLDPEMKKMALVNLYLHFIKTPKIFEYDTLTSEDKWDEQFEVILANPPFMTPKGGIQPHQRFQIKSSRSEPLFVDYICQHLSVNGRAGIIVPEGIIFRNENAYKDLRKNLIEQWGLYGVVSLPPGVFQPYSGIKTNILFIDKKLNANSILFMDIKNDGFDLGSTRKKNDKNDLGEAFEIIKKYKRTQTLPKNQTLAHLVPKSKIISSEGYQLQGNLYKTTTVKSYSKNPIVELGEVCEIVNGNTPSKKNPDYWKNGTINWLTITDLRKQGSVITNTNEKITRLALKETGFVPQDSILLSCSASIGLAAITKIPLAIDRRFKGLVIKRKRKLHPNFLLLVIQSKLFQEKLNNATSQTTFKEVSSSRLKKIQIPLPPPEVQDEITKRVEQEQKIMEGAKQVVHYWKPNLWINENWKPHKLVDICEIKKGELITKNQSVPGEIPVVAGGKMPPYYHNKPNTEGDVITVSCSGSAGFVNYWESPIFASDCSVIKSLDNSKATTQFVYFALKTQQEEIYKLKKGSTIPHVYPNQLVNIQIPLPPLNIQMKIVEEQKMVDGCKQLIKNQQQKIANILSTIWQ